MTSLLPLPLNPTPAFYHLPPSTYLLFYHYYHNPYLGWLGLYSLWFGHGTGGGGWGTGFGRFVGQWEWDGCGWDLLFPSLPPFPLPAQPFSLFPSLPSSPAASPPPFLPSSSLPPSSLLLFSACLPPLMKKLPKPQTFCLAPALTGRTAIDW